MFTLREERTMVPEAQNPAQIIEVAEIAWESRASLRWSGLDLNPRAPSARRFLCCRQR
jgi:hypothetical protein